MTHFELLKAIQKCGPKVEHQKSKNTFLRKWKKESNGEAINIDGEALNSDGKTLNRDVRTLKGKTCFKGWRRGV